MVFFSVLRRDAPGPRVQFACPACLAAAAAGETYERHETFRALHLIPLFSVRNTYVVCGTCHAHLLSQLTLDDLRQHADSDISPFLSFSISLVAKALSVLAILLCWFPFVGIALAAIALAATYKRRTIWRTLAIISLVVSLLLALGFVILMTIASFAGPHR
jgi:hypothetical protein